MTANDGPVWAGTRRPRLGFRTWALRRLVTAPWDCWGSGERRPGTLIAPSQSVLGAGVVLMEELVHCGDFSCGFACGFVGGVKFFAEAGDLDFLVVCDFGCLCQGCGWGGCAKGGVLVPEVAVGGKAEVIVVTMAGWVNFCWEEVLGAALVHWEAIPATKGHELAMGQACVAPLAAAVSVVRLNSGGAHVLAVEAWAIAANLVAPEAAAAWGLFKDYAGAVCQVGAGGAGAVAGGDLCVDGVIIASAAVTAETPIALGAS